MVHGPSNTVRQLPNGSHLPKEQGPSASAPAQRHGHSGFHPTAGEAAADLSPFPNLQTSFQASWEFHFSF